MLVKMMMVVSMLGLATIVGFIVTILKQLGLYNKHIDIVRKAFTFLCFVSGFIIIFS